MTPKPTRCPWVGINKPHYEQYHDYEWGVPVYDDVMLFELLILEGAQAGLTWETILKRRDAYRMVFKNFKPEAVASMTDIELELILQNPGIIRNRLKVYSARTNAQQFIKIQQEYGSFATFIWGFVNNLPLINRPKSMADIPASTPLSERISKDLKNRGMRFVGPTIIYAYLQAIGIVNDHLVSCFLCQAE